MSIAEPRRLGLRSRARGASLIELLIAIVVVGLAVTGVLSVTTLTVGHSADTLARKQALAIGETLLEEIAARPFTWCDPDDSKATGATGVADCAAQPENLGPETGETRYANPFFDNVNDYRGFAMNAGIVGLDGAAVPGLGDYSASVNVSQAGESFGLAASEALRIDVSVSGRGETVGLSAYRFRHSPNVGG